MGVPGRKPSVSAAVVHPTALVVTGEVDALPMPPELLTDAGVKVWKTVLPDLVKMNMFQASDGLMLVEFCETLASAQEFRREATDLQRRLKEADAEEDAVLAEALSGRLKRARAGYLQSMKMCMSISGEFGVSPVARLRLGLMRIQGQATLLGAFTDTGED